MWQASMAELTILWPPPPTQWPLGHGAIHVWAGNLQAPEERILALAKTLSSDETARAARFHSDRDRNRFIVGRGLLRTILTRYVGGVPTGLAFSYGPKGKPALASTARQRPPLFSVAHGEDLLILAVSRDCEVGVDVEYIRPCEDAESIAANHFSSHEASVLRSLPAAQRLEAFYRLWTRKEAWLKATGDGIGESLSQVEVSFLANEPARLVSLFGSAEAVQNWTLCEIHPAAGFMAALAAPAPDIRLNCWHWPG
jgi:4'-phosphopantetheinyl transferase